MKEKVLKYLRWIFFMPLSILFALITTYTVFMNAYQYTGGVFLDKYIDPYFIPIISSYCFFISCRYLIPSTEYIKTRTPLIIILLCFPLELVIYGIYFYALIKGKTEFEFKYIASFLGYITVFIEALYYLFSRKGQEELDNEKL